MKRRLVVAIVIALGGAARVADAKILELYAQIQGGGASGRGMAGMQKDNDFFHGAQGAAYGALIGAEVLYLDAWVEHVQLVNGDGLAGTWTQFMAGADIDIALSSAPKDEKGKAKGEA